MNAAIIPLRPHAADTNARIAAGQALARLERALAWPNAVAAQIGHTADAIADARGHLGIAAAADRIVLPVMANHVVQSLCRAVWPQCDEETPTPLLGARAALRAAVACLDRRDWLAAHRMLAVASAFIALAEQGF